MDWIDRALDQLAGDRAWQYHVGGPVATEPAALTALALIGAGRWADATDALRWLCRLQSVDGSVGVTANHKTPCWPTGWAVLAWTAAQQAAHDTLRFKQHIESGTAWLVRMKGKTLEQTADLAHNSLLVGWPWVDGTHSWVEPTAISVLALRSAGFAGHARTREAVKLLIDRLLPEGGCNYGNTFVLGQQLRPHLQPSGLCLAALAGHHEDGRIAKSLDYVQSQVRRSTTTASLCYALMGLAAHGRVPATAGALLAQRYEYEARRDPSAYKLALLMLASFGARSPLAAGTPAGSSS